MRYQNALDSCFFCPILQFLRFSMCPNKSVQLCCKYVFGFISIHSLHQPKIQWENSVQPQFRAEKKSDSCLFNCLAFFRIIKRKNVYQTSNTVLNGQREIPFDSCFTLFHLLDLLVANLSLVFNISAHFSFTSSSELKSKRPTTTKMYKTTR